MAKLYVDTIEPEGATTNLAIGEAGQDVILPGNDIRANVLQDAGGNAIFTSDGSGNVTGVNNGFGDSLTLISSQSASSSASLSFTSGIDSTYKEYIFKFYEINAASNVVDFSFQCSTDGGSNYNMTMTTTFFRAWHYANDTDSGLAYQDARDQAQGTAFQQLAFSSGNQAKGCMVGELHLFNPSSTTYIKNFYSRTNVHTNAYSVDSYAAGYINTALAIDEVSFKMSSGNFDGTIKMYGIK